MIWFLRRKCKHERCPECETLVRCCVCTEQYHDHKHAELEHIVEKVEHGTDN